MPEIIEIIDCVLRITGIIALLFGLLSFILDRWSYESNISIKRILNHNELNNLKFYHEYSEPGNDTEHTILTPCGCSIKSVKLFSTKFIKGKLKKDGCLIEFKNIEPGEGVLFNVYYNEGIPTRILEWTSDYGVRGEHTFSENGFSGVVDTLCYKYRYGLISKIRRQLGIK